MRKREKNLDEHVKMFTWTLEKRRNKFTRATNCLENAKKRYEKKDERKIIKEEIKAMKLPL